MNKQCSSSNPAYFNSCDSVPVDFCFRHKSFVCNMSMGVYFHREHVYAMTVWCSLSLPPENIRKPLDFLMFSGSVDKQHQTLID